MKTIKYFLITAALFVHSIFSLQAQSTEGKEFWLTFGDVETPIALSSNLYTIRIVNGSQATAGYISFKSLGTTEYFTINPFGIYEYDLSSTEKEAVSNTTPGISNKSIYIFSENPVTVYAGALRGSNGDVTNVLPLTTLNTEYYQISYRPWGTNSMTDAFAVVATQKNTIVDYERVSTPLNAGDVFYRTSFSDLTGNHISSNKPVALFAVNQYASIPHSTNPFSSTSRLFQQLAPINTWDRIFFVPVTIHQSNHVRIVVSQNNTNITQKGGTIQTDVLGAQTTLANLQAGDFVELIIHSADSGCYIQSEKPIAVCSYLTYSGASVPATPAQCWIP